MQGNPDNPASEIPVREAPAPIGSVTESVAAKERRALPRFAVEDRATVLVLSQGVSLAARIVELSEGGCRLQVPREFRVGVPERIEVAFRLNGMAFRLGAVTQWSDGRGTLGVGFLAMAERRREDLRALTAELGEEAARRAAKETERLAAAERTARQKSSPQKEVAGTFVHNESVPVTQTSSRAAAPQRPMPLESPHSADSRKTATSSAAASTGTASATPSDAADKTNPAKAHGRPARERRQQERHSVDTYATIYFIDVAARERGRILDVSMGGCRICTEERFPSGIYRRVETEFKIDGLPFRLAGVVQSLHDRHTVGIRFLNISERKRRYLQELMEEIEEMRHSGLLDQQEAQPSVEATGL